jgi:hypothetical protein
MTLRGREYGVSEWQADRRLRRKDARSSELEGSVVNTRQRMSFQVGCVVVYIRELANTYVWSTMPLHGSNNPTSQYLDYQVCKRKRLSGFPLLKNLGLYTGLE